MHTIFIESNTVDHLVFKDSSDKPVLELNVVEIGVDHVPASSIYLASKEEMQVLAYLINQKHGDSVQVREASKQHTEMALSGVPLIGKFMCGEVMAGGKILFEAIDQWSQAGKPRVRLCFFNPVALTYEDGMEHLLHTSVISVINTIRTAGLEVEYTLCVPKNIGGMSEKVDLHFGNGAQVLPIPASLSDLMEFDGVWDLSTMTPIDNSSEVVLDFLGVPTVNTEESKDDTSNAEGAESVPENTGKNTVSVWIKIWRKILRLFGIRL